MAIAVQIHDRDPEALADLIARTLRPDSAMIDPETSVAHLSALVDAEEREGEIRRASWRWLNSISATVDKDNDWSDV